MNICFRVDASITIGTGHVMRCLTLAEEFKKSNHEVYFICRLHDGHLCHLISDNGFNVIKLDKYEYKATMQKNTQHDSWLGTSWQQDIIETQNAILSSNVRFDWMIIDHYAIDKLWEQQIKKSIPHIMVIDDIADREHDCDILLDQNYYQNANSRYKDLVSENCKLLLGPKFALLRDEFIELHKLPKRQKHHKSALVFYGGSDPTNDTAKAINAIKDTGSTELTTHVVVGPSNQNKSIIKNMCEQNNYHFHYNIDYMAKLMHEVDFAVCAGGSTTWERYCVGTPAILTAIAYNQIELCENVQHLNIDHYIGTHENVTNQTIENTLKYFLQNRNIIKLNKKAKEIVDGHGKYRILKLLNTIK